MARMQSRVFCSVHTTKHQTPPTKQNRSMGISSMVATSEKDFVDIAVATASDKQRHRRIAGEICDRKQMLFERRGDSIKEWKSFLARAVVSSLRT